MTSNVMSDADVGDRPQVCDLGISTVSDPGVYDPPTIVAGDVVGQDLGERVPVAGREVRRDSARTAGLPRFPTAAPAG